MKEVLRFVALTASLFSMVQLIYCLFTLPCDIHWNCFLAGKLFFTGLIIMLFTGIPAFIMYINE